MRTNAKKQTCLLCSLPVAGFVSNPDKPENEGVSLNIAIIFAVAADGGLGAGPPPVLLLSLPKSENSFFAAKVRFFHLSLTSWAVLLATPTAFTAAVISVQIFFSSRW